MSAIEKELQKAADVSPKRGEEKESYLKRLIQAISELPDPDWNKLSKPAMVWFNDSADALGAKKDIPAFPDAEEEKQEETTTRRRSTAKEETAEPKVGDKVTILTKRDKTIQGELVEVTKDLYVIKEEDGEETEIDLDRIKSISVDEPPKDAPKKSRRRSAADEEDEGPGKTEPEVDDVIDAVTARGKELTGKVIEVGDDLLVIVDGDGEEVELTPSKLKSLTIQAAKKEEATTRRRSADDGKDTKSDKGDDKTKRTSTKANGGVSVTMRIREMIILDPEAKSEAIGKSLTKEGLEFRPNTLDLVYAETHKVLELCRKHKLIK